MVPAASRIHLERTLGRATGALAADTSRGTAGVIREAVRAGSRIGSISLAYAASTLPVRASIHCDSLRKYSRAGVSGAASMRNAIIGRFLDEARSISLLTCEDPMALSDNTSTMSLALLMARMIASAYWAPAFTSRGAIQH